MMRPGRPDKTGRKAVRSFVALLSCVALSGCGGDPIPSVPAAPATIVAVTPAPPSESTMAPTPSFSLAPAATPVKKPRPFVPTDWGRVAVPAFTEAMRHG